MTKFQIPSLILLMLLIFYPVFFMDYAYLDEAHQLWHQNDGSNFSMQVSHGRYVTGILMENLFRRTSSISDLKHLRILSFSGWLVVVVIYSILFRKWSAILGVEKQLIWLMNIFMACTLSLAIYVGWASCLQLFLAFGMGLLSGHVVFMYLTKASTANQAMTLLRFVSAFIMALASLFLYQTAFGAFLLPFFLYLIIHKFKPPGKVLLAGIAIYVAANLVYFALFKYSLHQEGLSGSDRSGLTFNIFRKLSFFISKALSQAFTFNFPYNFKGLFSQAFYPLVFLIWLVSIFRNYSGVTLKQKIYHVGMILLLLILIYLPLMISKESFASYRTLQSLNMAAFIALMDGILSFTRSQKYKWRFTVIACLIFSTMGFYNFHYNFIVPLKDEFAALRSFVNSNYNSNVRKLYVIRPQRSLFSKTHGVKAYEDEFGLPSTYKNWTPDPLFRQLIYEHTGNRQVASEISIEQFVKREDLPLVDGLIEKPLLIDVDEIVKAYIK